MATVGGQGSPGSVSRTARYRKVTKPLLERRRRARINRCLDELKDLMVGALEVERENISKLEKADILELTVRHLSKQRAPRDPRAEAERFQAGFGHCASEAYHFILSSPGVDSTITQQLVRHLSSQMNDGPIGFPALASPVPSDSSLSPCTSSKDYSPNYYAERSRTRSVVSPMEEYDRAHPGWKGDSSGVPVEQSLTCEVAPYNPRPVSARSSDEEGMPGLLMTVNSECAPRQFPANNLNSHIERHRPPEVKERYDIRNGPNSESKNLIMQKIREHILERQHREPDSPDSQQKRARHAGDQNHSYKDDTIQLKLSKNVSNLSVYSREPNARVVKRLPPPGTGEEAINLSSVPVAAEKYGEAEIQKYDFPKYVEGCFKAIKQQADYKNIHPKKVMIRTPKNNPHREEGAVSLERRNLDKPAINRLNPSRDADDITNGSEGDDSAVSFDDRDVSAAEAYYLRYKYREYNRQQQQCQDQVDEENMWRPW